MLELLSSSKSVSKDTSWESMSAGASLRGISTETLALSMDIGMVLIFDELDDGKEWSCSEEAMKVSATAK